VNFTTPYIDSRRVLVRLAALGLAGDVVEGEQQVVLRVELEGQLQLELVRVRCLRVGSLAQPTQHMG
jgi:hypothetical protein